MVDQGISAVSGVVRSTTAVVATEAGKAYETAQVYAGGAPGTCRPLCLGEVSARLRALFYDAGRKEGGWSCLAFLTQGFDAARRLAWLTDPTRAAWPAAGCVRGGHGALGTDRADCALQAARWAAGAA